MDVGVGSVLVTQALAWRGAPELMSTFGRRLKRTALAVVPLLALGLARLATVKSTGYYV